MNKTKILAFSAVMAALSNILSLELFTIPVMFGPFPTKIHFTQLPIFLSGLLAGPYAGLLTGAIGSLYMSATVIPFIVVGLALLGFSTGLLARRFKLRPFFSSVLAWCIQSVYVYVTDYIWFTLFQSMPAAAASGIVTTILIKLTIEAVVSSFLAEILFVSMKKSGVTSVFFEFS